MTENGIVERVQKLLALALNNSNEQEAAAAMAKARELMLRHAIDEASVSGAKPASDTEVFIIDLGRVFDSWMKQTQAAVCDLFDGQLYWGKKRSGGRYTDIATIVCSAHDLLYLKAAYAQAVATILTEARQRSFNGVKYVNSFKLGAARGFWVAVLEGKKVELKPDETAIVHVKRGAIIARGKVMFPTTHTARIKNNASDWSGYSDGYDFGKKMSDSKGNKQIK